MSDISDELRKWNRRIGIWEDVLREPSPDLEGLLGSISLTRGEIGRALSLGLATPTVSPSRKDDMEAWAKTQAEANRAVMMDAIRENVAQVNASNQAAFLQHWRYAMAASAMQGLLAADFDGGFAQDELVDQAVGLADAMMRRLAQQP